MSGAPSTKSRIVHLALKVMDLERATRFYEDVFGFRQTGTGHARGHVSRHMTDGAFDLALMVYDNENVHEAQLSGAGPCIHHFGIEVVRAGRYRKAPSGNGARISGLAITTRERREASDFYSAVFGFDAAPDGRQLTDGSFTVTLLDGAPAHHHWTVQVGDVARFASAIEQNGGIPEPTAELLYRTPDGSLLQIVSP